MCCVFMLFIFFFQAEDGIRDWSVTGVQTCALPISFVRNRTARLAQAASRRALRRNKKEKNQDSLAPLGSHCGQPYGMARALCRSEERRVGKECRYGWWTDAETKK